MFFRKGKKIEELVLRHLHQVDTTLAAFHESLIAYVVKRDIETAKEYAFKTHNEEGRADDIRREVEKELLSGALLAASRRDILEIIEQVDRLANSGEATLDTLLLERIEIPEEIVTYIEQIAEETGKIRQEVNSALHALFHDPANTTVHTKEIENLEGKVDHLEREALKTIFKMEIDLARKLQLREFIEELVEISDRAEDLSDRIDIMVAERIL